MTQPDPPAAEAMRQDLAAIIRAVMQAPTLAEQQRLIVERNRLGKQLAQLLKNLDP